MSLLVAAGLFTSDGKSYVATLQSAWRSMLDIHGGYVAALAAGAVERTIDDAARPLRSFTVQFLRPAHAGEIGIDVNIVKAGRSLTFLQATVRQDHKTVLTASGVAATRRGGLSFNDVVRPSASFAGVPAGATRFTGPNPGEHFEQFDLRLEPELSIFGGHDHARVAGWIRPLNPGEIVDAPWLICATDVMPPSMVFRTTQPVQAASVEMSVQLTRGNLSTAVPSGAFVYGEMICSVSAEGFAVEDGTFWSPTGELLATSRQVRLAGTPASDSSVDTTTA
jgi:acyl-CoA thioesterase